MSKNMKNENRNLDEFFDEPSPKQYGVQRNGYANAVPQKKNTVIMVLLSVLVVIGIGILMIQIFNPFVSGSQNLPDNSQNNNGNHIQNGTPPANGGNDEGGGLYGPGPGNGGENGEGGGLFGPGPGGNEGGGILSRQGENGEREYSTDGGKTWSKTPPDGKQVPQD